MSQKHCLYMETTRNYYSMKPDYIDQFRNKGYDVRFIIGQEFGKYSEQQILDMFEECEIACVCITPVTEKMIERAKNLKLICTFGAGYDHIDVTAATERGIPVVNGRGGGAVAVSELVVSMMLALARKLPLYNRQMREAVWQCQLVDELHGKTAGIIGVGAIGAELAHILHNGFNMRILAHDVVENGRLVQDTQATYVDLDTLCRESDYISIHTPLLPSTRGMLNSEKLALMKKTAVIINAARGGILDEDALYNALERKEIGGAGLDVFAEEPFLNGARFQNLDNVIMTPHVAANTPETVERIANLLTQDIEDVLNGLPPRQNVVNRQVL